MKWSLAGINSGFADTVAEIAQVQRLIEVHPQYFTAVRSAADLQRARRDGLLGIILSFESTDMLGDKLDAFTTFRNLGVRVMQLSYNRKSPFAAGVMEPGGGGLTPLGRDAVREMNRLGIAIDLSHANAATTSDVLGLSTRPPIDAHRLCGRARSPAHQERCAAAALAAKGGVVRILTCPTSGLPAPAQYLRYMQHRTRQRSPARTMSASAACGHRAL